MIRCRRLMLALPLFCILQLLSSLTIPSSPRNVDLIVLYILTVLPILLFMSLSTVPFSSINSSQAVVARLVIKLYPRFYSMYRLLRHYFHCLFLRYLSKYLLFIILFDSLWCFRWACYFTFMSSTDINSFHFSVYYFHLIALWFSFSYCIINNYRK